MTRLRSAIDRFSIGIGLFAGGYMALVLLEAATR